MSKAQLRASLRLKRRNLDSATRQYMDQKINAAVLDLVEEAGFTKLAAFWPFDGEPDLRPALKQLDKLNIQIALPVIDVEQAEPAMLFRVWTTTGELKKNRFGIEEPVNGELISPDSLDLLLTPLLAWDVHGHRLGMGAGYYDRALSHMRDMPTPVRTGVAYDLQRTDSIPTDPWDIDLHLVLTEKGRFTCLP